MAATDCSKKPELSKAEYLKRYLSADEDVKKSKGKLKKKRRKVPEKGLKIVDDDIDWKQMVIEEEENEEDEEEAPVIAEIIDERPEEVKQLEAFRTSNRWKVIGADEIEDTEEGEVREDEPLEPGASNRSRHDSPELSPKRRRHDSPVKKTRHDSPDVSPPRRGRHDSPDISPQKRGRHDSPDISPKRRGRHDSPDISPKRRGRHDSPDISPKRRGRHDSPDISPPRRGRHDLSPPRQHSGKSGKVQSKDSSPARRKPSSSSSNKNPDRHRSPLAKRAQNRHDSDLDQSPPRKKTLKGDASDSDQSPPRMRSKTRRGSDSDQSPPRRRAHAGKDSDEDLSPPRRPGQSQGPRMLSGGAAGLVPLDVLRKEQEENRRRDRNNQPLEDESRNAQTVFRDKSGKRRDLDTEREEQRRKAGEKAAKDEKYAQWGRGLAQGQMQQQKLEDAVHEAHKPLARHCDDEDLDRMLREQEREGDPMAAMLRRKKDRNPKTKEKPRYKGPAPPPNRFNLLPGYRWDGVDRSNGFEKKRYMRMADKKAVQEAAYKWSVEDM
ncbi:BUD13 homolog [Pagrus major]|uniref:BUD13 homolog n=1 Tax=Pagrus major TaxID=143350 RepID=UPI003CC86ABF